MQGKVTYEYAVIRLVPKVEREEFLNIGVILFSKHKNFLGIKYDINEARIKAFHNEVDVEMIRDYLEGWELICQGAPFGGKIGMLDIPSRFRWLAAARSTIIQTSQTHTGLSSQPEVELVRIFNRFVL